MAYKLQTFQDGSIHRDGNEYLFIKNAKVKGRYESITALVKAHPPDQVGELFEVDLKSKRTKKAKKLEKD